jgi:hypothetical protein
MSQPVLEPKLIDRNMAGASFIPDLFKVPRELSISDSEFSKSDLNNEVA